MLFQKKLISGHVIIQEHELEKVSVIHIAGTKGKGSTSAFTESILRQHGYRTGLFTSPHMNQIRERICINGKPISEEKFCCYFWEVFKNFEDSVVRNYLLCICLITVINFTTCSNFRRVANIFCVSRLTKGRSEGFKYFTAFVSFLLSAGGIVFRFQIKGHLLKHPYNVQFRYFITSVRLKTPGLTDEYSMSHDSCCVFCSQLYYAANFDFLLFKNCHDHHGK